MSIQWTNPTIGFCHGESIVEWDMKAANLSLIRYYHLAKQPTIDRISKMDKTPREIYVGKMCQKSKDFAVALEKAFDDIIELFLTTNELDRDRDVVAIRKDAVFVRNRRIRQSTFGDVVEFRPKGSYSGFLKLPKYEFYYSPKVVDVKGVSDALLPLHTDGVLQFIRDVFEESSNWTELNRYLKEYSKAYKEKQLPFDAYREFNENSKFLVRMFGNDLYMDLIDESLLASTSIRYNYEHVYLETLKTILNR